jgi:hypothetical protein
MKKKILLTALTVFSIMIAGKSFGQSYDASRYGYNSYNNYYTYNNQRDMNRDTRDIRHDRRDIRNDLRLIEIKKRDIQRDLYYNDWFAYRRDKMQLDALYRDINYDHFDIRRDRRDLRADERF